MKLKILITLLLVTSLFGYLEWAGNNGSFLIEAEFRIFRQLFTHPKNIFHPFILLPLIGQLLLFTTLIQKKPNKFLTYIGITCLSLLLGFICVIGVLSLNFKIFTSTIPFLVFVTLTTIHLKTRRK